MIPQITYWYKAYFEYYEKDHEAARDSSSKMKGVHVWSSALAAANFILRLGNQLDAGKEMQKFLASTTDENGKVWTLAQEYNLEASAFSSEDDVIYWLQGLRSAGMPDGDGLPANILEKLN